MKLLYDAETGFLHENLLFKLPDYFQKPGFSHFASVLFIFLLDFNIFAGAIVFKQTQSIVSNRPDQAFAPDLQQIAAKWNTDISLKAIAVDWFTFAVCRLLYLRLMSFIGYPHTIQTVGQVMQFWQRFIHSIRKALSDESFLKTLRVFEGLISKLLSIAMVFVILLAVYDLITFLITDIFSQPYSRLGTTLFTIFGLFLNVLIALEILENITAYLKNHSIQVELVIATSLVAISRKIIILDLQKTSGLELIALAATIFSLSISYWLVRGVHRRSRQRDADDT